MDVRSRRHFDAIAKAMQLDGEARRTEALTLTQFARMSEGYELGKTRITPGDAGESLDRRALGQAELHARARRLKVAFR